MQPSGDQSQITTVAPPPIHGDVLETVLSYLPLINLVPKSLVSKSWNDAVSSVLKKSHKLQPWLILHTQSSRPPHLTTTQAYDPSSQTWIKIYNHPSIDYVSALKTSQTNLLYMLSQSRLSFSFDPLYVTWHHAVAPRVWRVDPILAVVNKYVIVAGGSCDFEHDPLAVEIYDMESCNWTQHDPMPDFFQQCASSMWHSIATDDTRMFVLEKNTGVMHTFDPLTNNWFGPYDLCVLCGNRFVFHTCIGFADQGLILVGMLGDSDDDVTGIKMWKVDCESFDRCDEIAEMPVDLVEKLKGGEFKIPTIGVRMMGNVVYIYKPVRTDVVIVCEYHGDGECRWWSVDNVVASDRSIMERFVFTCSNVGIDELQQATRSNVNRRFRFGY